MWQVVSDIRGPFTTGESPYGSPYGLRSRSIRDAGVPSGFGQALARDDQRQPTAGAQAPLLI